MKRLKKPLRPPKEPPRPLEKPPRLPEKPPRLPRKMSTRLPRKKPLRINHGLSSYSICI